MIIFKGHEAQERWIKNDLPMGPVKLEWAEDHYVYYFDRRFHREDGPAISYPYGKDYPLLTKDYCLHGKRFETAEEWFDALDEEQQTRALFNIDEWASKKRKEPCQLNRRSKLVTSFPAPSVNYIRIDITIEL